MILSLLASAAACGGPTPEPTATDVRPEDHPFPAADACDGMRVVRAAPWTGGGLQLTVVFDVPPVDVDELALSGLPNRTPTLSLATPPSSSGYTGVVLVPSADRTELAARVAAATALVDEAPAGDRVIAWLAGDRAEVLADATFDRDHVAAR
ncbi:MAG: hypothetical protein EP329_28060, partial [Deltaproteobacteria bacterium]